jgi:adenine deaminase
VKVDGSGTATRFETKTPEEPSVKLARKASWPKLLIPLGRPSLLPVPMLLLAPAKMKELIVRKSPGATSSGSPVRTSYMTFSFMALLVTPALNLSDRGLFDSGKFEFS